MSRIQRWAPFLAVETATLLSGSANGVAVVALPWLIIDLTGSATAAGVMAAVTAIPTMVAALLSGTVVDFVGRKRVSIFSDVASLVAVALIPVLDATVGLSYGLVVVLAVAGAVFDPAGFGAREAMLPEAARHARLALPKANGYHEATFGAAFLLGPGLGGLLIAWVGPAGTFWAAAAMFAVSILAIAAVQIPGAARPSEHERPEGFWSGTAEGLRFIWDNRLLRTMALLIMALVAAYLPVEGVLLPYFFQQQGSPGSLGLAIMAMSAGGIVGALSYGRLAQRFTTRAIFVWSLLATALVFVPIALLPPLPLLLPLAFAVGMASGPINPVMNVVMQTRTPSRLRGRVVGVLTATAYAAGPIGYLLAGPLVDGIGVRAAMTAFALVFLIVALLGFTIPALREADRIQADPVPPVEEAPPPRPG